MALFIFFTIVTSLTVKRGTSLLCNRQTKIAPDMASQKTMRSFFQTSKPAEILTNKKPRQEESVKNVHAPPGSFALSSHSGPAIDDEGDSSCSPSGLTNEVWRKRLAKEFSKPYFVKLSDYVEAESARYNVYPPKAQVYAAFNLCSFDDIKVVIIGQDPYHGAGQAHGLCFSVSKGVQVPPSLRNMIQELKADPANNVISTSHGNLECWARQGVLLLNTCMTVREGEANSHQNKGWETFTDAVIEQLASKSDIVYLLWGNPAQSKCKGINASRNHMIKTSHPSPLGAYKTASPFMGSKCFSRTNEILVKLNKTPIDWNIV